MFYNIMVIVFSVIMVINFLVVLSGITILNHFPEKYNKKVFNLLYKICLLGTIVVIPILIFSMF